MVCSPPAAYATCIATRVSVQAVSDVDTASAYRQYVDDGAHASVEVRPQCTMHQAWEQLGGEDFKAVRRIMLVRQLETVYDVTTHDLMKALPIRGAEYASYHTRLRKVIRCGPAMCLALSVCWRP